MTETKTDKLIGHAPPPQQQRHEAIVALVTQRQYITVAEAKAVTGASLSTVRRDLDDLDRAGALQRIHGGATAAATTTDLAELRHHVARVAQVLAAGNVDAAHHLLVRTLAVFERLRSDRSHR
ncbi:DeoR family transcriptional regulator [Dactylosporangium sp. NPDC050688]|uniref:DeoR family transcriptional regulator n=1 Tax=Dactylosporangium sp. NPDC050688 TaxID=3157217 RepID=UPI003410EE09